MIDPFAYRNPALHARIGIGRADITPSSPTVPINNWGAATVTQSQGIADRITATVLIVAGLDRPDEPELVWASLDLGWWRQPASETRIRTRLAAQLGLDVDRVLLSLSHTHAGPAIDPTSPQMTEQTQVIDYLETIANGVCAAADQAVSDAAPALLEWGRGSCHLAWNRDQWVPDESRYICGFDPGQPADSTLLVGRVVPTEPGTDEVRAVVVNYACHPTTLGPGNSALSGDYVAVARDLVEATVNAPMIFVQGASGELAPRRQYQPDRIGADSAVQANGKQLGYAVLSTLAGMLPSGKRLVARPTIESGAPLGIWELERDVDVDRHVASFHQGVSVPRNTARPQWDGEASLAPEAATERTSRAAGITQLAGDGGEHRIPVSVIRLGDAIWVAQPGEAYSLLQRDLRSRFPDRPIVVANLTGGAHHGYLPPEALYARNLYQVWQTPAGPGALELVRDVCTEQISALIADEEAP